MVTCVTSTSHGGNGSFKRPREKGTMPMRKPHTCGKRGGERRAEHLHAKGTMPMRNQAHLEQLRPDCVRNQTQSDAIRRNQTQSGTPRAIAAGRHTWLSSAETLRLASRGCRAPVGKTGGAVVSTRASAQPVVVGDRVPCRLQSRGNQEALPATIKRQSRGHQEAIKRQSRGNQEAIRRPLTTHHDRAPCGLGSEPFVESG